MNWEALGAIGELVGALAVVATLGYLALQLRSNTRAIEMEARQSVLDRFTEAHKFILPPESTQTALIRGIRDFDSLTDDETMAMTQALSVFANNLYNAKRMYDEGVLDEEALAYIRRAFVGTCSTTGGSKWWAHVKGIRLYPEDLVTFVDAEIAKGTSANVEVMFNVSKTEGST